MIPLRSTIGLRVTLLSIAVKYIIDCHMSRESSDNTRNNAKENGLAIDQPVHATS